MINSRPELYWQIPGTGCQISEPVPKIHPKSPPGPGPRGRPGPGPGPGPQPGAIWAGFLELVPEFSNLFQDFCQHFFGQKIKTMWILHIFGGSKSVQIFFLLYILEKEIILFSAPTNSLTLVLISELINF